MSSTLIPTALSALVSQFSSALTAAGVSVIDGPVMKSTQPKLLLVGCGDSETDGEVPFEQQWAGLGHVARNETFSVPHLLRFATGNPSVANARTTLFGWLATVESSLRTTPTIGIATNSVRAQFGTTGRFLQTRTPNGLVVRVEFNVNVEARI